ncbi:hypothetical protein Ahy_A09g043117 [Arachis hypogaea]|uniref:Uncharacterized protein n=1 Tax=Arachis hypogaea TaxID=3818 RepID=A0A445BHJ7_ARAHY|nr:hypothetical protein Ahy_A09g043117 [Arachis hypogaea]
MGGPKNLTFIEMDVRNYNSHNLCIVGDEMNPKELLKHFSRMKELNPNFFFDIDVDKNHKFRNVYGPMLSKTLDFTFTVRYADQVFHKHQPPWDIGTILFKSMTSTSLDMLADRHIWVPEQKELECNDANLRELSLVFTTP